MSGNTTSVAVNQDVRIQGSNVVSSQGTQVLTGRDLSIEAATDTRHETHAYTEKQSGLFSGGGFGITIGTQQQKTDQDMQGGTAAASTIGSTAGNVLLQAGQAYTQTGSDTLAPQGSIDIVAPHVDIVAAREVRRSQTNTQFTQSGLTLALSSPLISAVQTAVQMKDAASQTTDSRMQALAAANTGMAAYNAATAVQESGASSGINLTLSLGASRSRSQVVQNSDSGRGSSVSAGGDVAIAATGAKAGSDLTVQGSTLQAGNDIRLAADNAIQLLAGKNTADQQSTNNSVSGAVGINIGSRGLGVPLSASAARGNADGNDVTYANSHVEAGRQLILQSGGDTTLKGALAKAEQITAEVSGHLAIDSLQDTSTFKSRQQSLGGSVTVGAGASGSLSFSQSKIDSDFASVAEQSGLKAGDGGFQVAVKGDADLKGGAIGQGGSGRKEPFPDRRYPYHQRHPEPGGLPRQQRRHQSRHQPGQRRPVQADGQQRRLWPGPRPDQQHDPGHHQRHRRQHGCENRRCRNRYPEDLRRRQGAEGRHCPGAHHPDFRGAGEQGGGGLCGQAIDQPKACRRTGKRPDEKTGPAGRSAKMGRWRRLPRAGPYGYRWIDRWNRRRAWCRYGGLLSRAHQQADKWLAGRRQTSTWRGNSLGYRRRCWRYGRSGSRV